MDLLHIHYDFFIFETGKIKFTVVSLVHPVYYVMGSLCSSTNKLVNRNGKTERVMYHIETDSYSCVD